MRLRIVYQPKYLVRKKYFDILHVVVSTAVTPITFPPYHTQIPQVIYVYLVSRTASCLHRIHRKVVRFMQNEREFILYRAQRTNVTI